MGGVLTVLVTLSWHVSTASIHILAAICQVGTESLAEKITYVGFEKKNCSLLTPHTRKLLREKNGRHLNTYQIATGKMSPISVKFAPRPEKIPSDSTSFNPKLVRLPSTSG